MSSLLRVALLLTLGLVGLGRGLVYLNDRLADAERAVYPAASGTAAEPAAPAAAVAPAPAATAPLPPPTDTQMLALGTARGQDLAVALNELRKHAVTPDLLQALDATAAREPHPEILRLIQCHKARAGGTPLSVAFDALPVERDDVDWGHDSAHCLIDVIAARAEEDRDRSIQLFAARALESWSASTTVVQALRRLDPAELPAPLAEGLAGSRGRTHRIHAATAAVAIGAAAKWPDQVAAWLRDETLYGAVRQGLAERTDAASMRLLAREITGSPGDQNLLGIAGRFSRKPGTLDLALAAIAADPQAASFARGHAAHLIGLYGGEEAARTLVAIKADDPTVAAALAAAGTALDQRVGPSLRTGAPK